MNREIQMISHGIVKRNLKVKKIENLSPTFKKLVFESPELDGFVSSSPDDHIKVFFDNNEMRDYTPMHFDTQKNELTLLFHLHQDGTASNWARNAKVGDTILIGGPRGSRVVPYNFDWYLFIVDETGVPALIRYLNELPPSAKVECIIEVQDKDNKLSLPTRDNLKLHWVYRNNTGEDEVKELKNKLNSIELSQGDAFTWIMQEKNIVKEIKNYLIDKKSFNPKWIKATGYWIKQ